MKTAAFDVMLNGVRLNTVFKPAHLNAAQVRNWLVANEFYLADIEVEKLG
jgi:hypothetical protein